MNGVLVIDKPPVLTSHDVVAAARRTLGETKIGHTGTLDPLATGVLPLAIGRATRLVRFFAFPTRTTRRRSGSVSPPIRMTSAAARSVARMPCLRLSTSFAHCSRTGDACSRPRVLGKKGPEDAAPTSSRATSTPLPSRLPPSAWDALIWSASAAAVLVVLTCSASFYVRSFAHTLGELTGTGACLEALRRTRSGEFCLDNAIPIAELSEASRVASALIPLSALLHHVPAIAVNSRGLERVAHGRGLEPGDYERWPAASLSAEWVRLLVCAAT